MAVFAPIPSPSAMIGDGGKAFVLQKHSKAITNVVKERVHDSLGVNADLGSARLQRRRSYFAIANFFATPTEGIETERKVRRPNASTNTLHRVLPGIRIKRLTDSVGASAMTGSNFVPARKSDQSHTFGKNRLGQKTKFVSETPKPTPTRARYRGHSSAANSYAATG